MPFDGIVMYKILNEIRPNIIGDRIKNIYQPVNYQVLLQFSHYFVLFSLQNPSYLILLSEKPDIPMQPGNYAQYLRKKLRNGKVLDIKQFGLDRLGFFEIESYDEETSQKRNYKLFFELMGRNSNLILVNQEGKIEEPFRKIYDEFRPLTPGIKYIPYYDDSKINLLEKQIQDIDINSNDLMGFSKKSLEFLKIVGVERSLKDLKDPYLFFYIDENKYDISAITPDSFKYIKLNPSEALLKVFQERANQSRVLETKKDLERRVKSQIEKLEKTKQLILEDILKENQLEELEKNGQLLQTYLYKIKKGERYVIVNDWSSGKEVTIEVDPLLSPPQNLERYYKEIKRTKKRIEFAKKRLNELESELKYLYQLLETVESAEDIGTLTEIKEEMREVGLIGETKKSQREKRVKTTYRKFEYNGFEILIGKNNKQNDELTRSAAKEDLWLHTHEVPGSHVIIKSAGKNIPAEAISYAARLAATFSQAKMSSNVAVDYTQKKNVWKPKGAKPGMWLYKNYETIIVEPLRDIP
ncbi:NFACT family protein [Petrotoga sp. 9PWA.NaAc.5.4]|uniref:Rqc2 family fibronectin-binding protein n=1 Tax=Petrotoga sp. 9PWA.NaAc.5.4 TaxID=1434328 RepID=UPI001304C1B2|nr:NFACT family protein [Petrotoga sp. 9PWA.NaAc.5.4]